MDEIRWVLDQQERKALQEIRRGRQRRLFSPYYVNYGAVMLPEEVTYVGYANGNFLTARGD